MKITLTELKQIIRKIIKENTQSILKTKPSGPE